MWIAIIFLLLLIGAGIFAAYWFLIRKKPAQKYSCKGTTCTKDAQGTYDSLDDCKKKCTQKYSCKGNTCIEDTQGKYESQDACNQACKKQKPSGSNAYCGNDQGMKLDCNTPCTPANAQTQCTNPGFTAGCFADPSNTCSKQLQMLGTFPQA